MIVFSPLVYSCRRRNLVHMSLIRHHVLFHHRHEPSILQEAYSIDVDLHELMVMIRALEKI